MQFRQDRQQDEKDMAFETSGELDEREAFAFSRNNNFPRRNYMVPTHVEKD